MRNLLKERTLLKGLTLGDIAFSEPNHKNIGCLREEGFVILQGSFHLAEWKNQNIQGIQFDLLKLLENGHVARIIITEEKQIKFLSKRCQLVHILHQFFKQYNLEDEFINFEFRSIPPNFEKCPNYARHHVKILYTDTMSLISSCCTIMT